MRSTTGRIEVSAAVEGLPAGATVHTYLGLDAARERCRQGAENGDVFVSRDYAAGIRRAFAGLAPGALAEFDRTTDPPPFPERDLRVVPGRS